MAYFGISAALLVSLLILGAESLQISGSSALYPQMLLGSSIVLLVWNGLKAWRADALSPDDPELASLYTGSTPVLLRFILFCAVWVLYPVFMTWTGFIASTVIVLFASVILFKTAHPWLALLGILGFTVLFSAMLKSIIYIPVPEAWPDRWLNALMYRF